MKKRSFLPPFALHSQRFLNSMLLRLTILSAKLEWPNIASNDVPGAGRFIAISRPGLSLKPSITMPAPISLSCSARV
jgi:hypothetical protein